MLNDQEVITLAQMLWDQHEDDALRLDGLHAMALGLAGSPDIPEGNTDEIKDLARLSVMNVCGPVIDAFAANLSVGGFRSTTAQDDDEVWQLWQSQGMDARQAEINRAALTYGTSYAVVLKDDVTGAPMFRPRSPRRLTAIYEDPQLDLWPVAAMESWVDKSARTWVIRGYVLDDEYAYPVVLGRIERAEQRDSGVDSSRRQVSIQIDPDRKPVAHGAVYDGRPVCPVVRFVNERSSEDRPVGEVEPIVSDQRAINDVNFARLTVARYGAHPQKVVVGWTAPKPELLKASAARAWAIDADPEDVRVQQMAGAALAPYTETLRDMVGHVGIDRQIPIGLLTGEISNLAADTIALVYGPHIRKTIRKQESLGEAYEQMLRLGAAMAGLPAPDASCEVVWTNVEARSFAGVVDGVTKLQVAGADLSTLVDLIPGLSQQKVREIQDGIRRKNAAALVAALTGQSVGAASPPVTPPASEPAPV